MKKWCNSPSLQKKKNKKFFASPTWSCEQIALSRQRRDGTTNIVAMVMINYKLVPRDDGLFKRNYFEQKKWSRILSLSGSASRRSSINFLGWTAAKGSKAITRLPWILPQSWKLWKTAETSPHNEYKSTSNSTSLPISTLQLGKKMRRRRKKMWHDDQNLVTKSEARVWELCVDLAFSLTWCRLSGLVRSKPPPPSFSDLTNRHQPSNTYFRRKVGKTSNGQ